MNNMARNTATPPPSLAVPEQAKAGMRQAARTAMRELADGILFQFLMVGSLSFSHIHDVVAAHGQAGWKSWLYPLSVDLLTVAAFRKIRTGKDGAKAGPFTWLAFLLGLFASLAANVIDSWTATPAGRVLAVAIGVWPAVALLVCTLLAHDHATEPVTVATVATEDAATTPATATQTPVATVATQPVAVLVAATTTPATTAPARQAAPAPSTTMKPATATIRSSAPAAKHTPIPTPGAAGLTTAPRTTTNTTVLTLIAKHGEQLTGPMVADALGLHRSNGSLRLKNVKQQLADGALDKHPEAAAAKAALSSSLSSSPQTTTTTAP